MSHGEERVYIPSPYIIRVLIILPLTDLGTKHSIGLPIHVYPLYENAFRAFRNQSVKDNNAESAQLYGDFAKVAEKNPLAWNYGKPAATAEFIGTVSKKNRLISNPCMLHLWNFDRLTILIPRQIRF